MYATRTFSFSKNSKKSNKAAFESLPEGPNSGVLAIRDAKPPALSFCCFYPEETDDYCKYIKSLPLPQNRNLFITNYNVSHLPVMFIPVLNQPLASSLYYVLDATFNGPFEGYAWTCSREVDKKKKPVPVTPMPLDPNNIYQQFHIIKVTDSIFRAKPVAKDGHLPKKFRREWRVAMFLPESILPSLISEAPGLDHRVPRERGPCFDFRLSHEYSTGFVDVGKWYCPFMFVSHSPRRPGFGSWFYEMSLEQRWYRIFTCNNQGASSSVQVDVTHANEFVYVGDRYYRIEWDEREVKEGKIWFQRGTFRVGLSPEIVEKIKWEQERAGWKSNQNREVRVQRVEEFKGGAGEWKNFGCYALVERFSLRYCGICLMEYNFLHSDRIRCKWE